MLCGRTDLYRTALGTSDYACDFRAAETLSHVLTQMNKLIALNCQHPTSLSLRLVHDDLYVYAISTLNICPNLTELVVHVYGGLNDGRIPSIQHWPDRPLRLSRLFLGGAKRSAEFVGHMLKHCPNLRCLGLCPADFDDHSSILNMAFQLCPDLSSLYYDQADEFAHVERKDYGNGKPGLRRLQAGPGATNVDDVLELFFRRSHNTSEELQLGTNATEPMHRSLKTLASLGAPRLEELSLRSNLAATSAQGKEQCKAVQSLIQNAAMLQTIRLRDINLEEWDAAMESMAGLKYLKEIHIRGCWHLPKKPLYSLFTEPQSLRRVVYEDDFGDRQSIVTLLEALAVKQPQKVDISSDNLDNDVVASAFATGWKEPTIESLTIRSNGMITRRTLILLATTLRRLETLTLGGLENVVEDDVYAYFNERKGRAVVYFEFSGGNVPCGRYIREENGTSNFIPDCDDD